LTGPGVVARSEWSIAVVAGPAWPVAIAWAKLFAAATGAWSTGAIAAGDVTSPRTTRELGRMIVQELASCATGKRAACDCCRVTATGPHVRARAAHVHEFVELVAGRSAATGAIEVATTRTICEVASIRSLAAGWPTYIAADGPTNVAAGRTGDVVATGAWQVAKGLPAAGWSLKGSVAAARPRHRRCATGKVSTAGASAPTASAKVGAAASASTSAAPTAAESAAAAAAACEQVVRDPSANRYESNH
jgi:hypothetical protein